jgi:hypothetical protein
MQNRKLEPVLQLSRLLGHFSVSEEPQESAKPKGFAEGDPAVGSALLRRFGFRLSAEERASSEKPVDGHHQVAGRL